MFQKDQRKASLSVIYTDLHGNPKPVRVKLKGHEKDASYDVDGTVYTGTALMRGGLLIPKPSAFMTPTWSAYMRSEKTEE